MNEKVNLPYFDVVLEKKDKNDDPLKDSLHMHWGYWDEPLKAVPEDRADFNAAAEKLCRLITDQVAITEGFKVADVGCGFGGTIDSLNKLHNNIRMVGINIDPRQIEVARSRVIGQNGNSIEFITGDAGELPFEDASIDALLAVECIFHFPDREKFFQEVGRVLKPGGKFALSDFVPRRETSALGQRIRKIYRRAVSIHFGGGSDTMSLSQYDSLADRCGLKSTCKMDITPNIMPTYVTLFERIDWSKKGSLINWFSSKMLWLSQRSGQVRYMILGFQKTGS